jgi:hypothetical protein
VVDGKQQAFRKVKRPLPSPAIRKAHAFFGVFPIFVPSLSWKNEHF